MKRLTVVAVAVVLSLLAVPSGAEAKCRTHECWNRVHLNRVENSVEKKIARITPYRCSGYRVAVPCWVIYQESSMDGFWLALNGGHRNPDSRVPCSTRACGIYQFLGWDVPWPVIIVARASGAIERWRARYETLKRMLAHHRMARTLPMSAWGG